MSTSVLDRVAETTGGKAAEDTSSTTRAMFAILPWSAALPADDFVTMLDELRVASTELHRTGNPAMLEALLREWEATAEAYSDRRFLQQLARPGKTYVVWR